MAGTVRPDIVDWPNSEWPIARNGSNQYVLTTTGGTAPLLTVTHRDAWL
jgi:hypothetical protein